MTSAPIGIPAPLPVRAPRLVCRQLLIGAALVVLCACEVEPASDLAASGPADAPVTREAGPAGGTAGDAELSPGDDGNCPVVASRNWSARVAGGDAGERRLHVEGEIDLPTPGYTADWSEGPADRRIPPAQHLILGLSAPTGATTQVLTSMMVEYEGDAIYPEYRAILVRCGDVILASITDIDQQQTRSDET